MELGNKRKEQGGLRTPELGLDRGWPNSSSTHLPAHPVLYFSLHKSIHLTHLHLPSYLPTYLAIHPPSHLQIQSLNYPYSSSNLPIHLSILPFIGVSLQPLPIYPFH